MRNLTILSIAFATLASPTLAQDVGLPQGLTLRPMILTDQGGEGATLGVAYELEGNLWKREWRDDETGNDPDFGQPHSFVTLGFSGSGVVTAEADQNPENFIDFALALEAGRTTGDDSILGAGGFVRVEADQAFQEQQWVLGAQVNYADYGILGRSNDWFFVMLGYGQVTPGEDTARQAALGSADLQDYYRAELEVGYNLHIGSDTTVRALQLNYRYFREIDASPAIVAADLDTFQLATVRLDFGQGFFAAYSDGRLPFDRQSDQTIKVGFSYQLF